MFKLAKMLFNWFERDKLPAHNPFPFTLTIAPNPGEKGYTVTCKELPELITCGDTVDEALEMAKDAYLAVLEIYLYHDIGKRLPNND